MIKIRIHSGLAPGDTLMCTCGVRDLHVHFGDKYAINVATNHMRIWDYNPHLSPVFKEAHIDVRVGPGIGTRGSHRSGLHYANAFRLSLESILNIKIPQGPVRADIHLSEQEKAAPPLVDGHYWILMNGRKEPGQGKFTSKTWPWERWQEVINALPWITFVQAGSPDDTWQGLQGDNIINLVQETFDLRKLMKLFYHAQGSFGLISLQMHMAAAFNKPCVVIAGAREPATFEAYPDHRFLHFQGSMKCSLLNKQREPVPNKWQQGGSLTWACWRDGIEACGQRTEAGYAKCLDMVQAGDVVRAIESYYEGGRLGKPGKTASVYIAPKKPIFRMIAGARAYLGGERSVCTIMRMMEKAGYAVEFVLKPGAKMCEGFKKNIGAAKITHKLTEPCDILMLYANDWIYELNKPAYQIFEKIQANKKLMVLNYRLGKAGQVPWTLGWNEYFFLNSSIRNQFLDKLPELYSTVVQTRVLAPPVILEPFLVAKPKYKQRLHLLKHSSQGDNKHPKETEELIYKIREAHSPLTVFSFMPPPSFLPDIEGVRKLHTDEISVLQFLGSGNCYWYPLKKDFNDMGPRAIVEAMAAGLPILADNRGGAKERVTEETGWLCDSFEDYPKAIAGVTVETLQQKGQAAKERAREEFDPEKWVKAIT